MSQVLTESIARNWGASVAEEVIQTVCDGCAKGNLDFAEPYFCPIQVNYDGPLEDMAHVRERIVRCKDCKHCVADPEPIDPGWPLMCDETGRDMLEPEGFCKWGERRADHD